MKKILFIIIFFFSFSLKAQYQIFGTIKDSLSNELLAGAFITLEGTHKKSTSDYQGKFYLDGIKKGNYTLIVSYLGYKKYIQRITINNHLELTIKMESSPILTDEIEIISTRADKNSPITQTIVNKEELQNQNLGKDIPILLDQTPSVVVNSDAGNGIGYTGIRIRGTDITRTNVTINGIPVNDAESQGVFWVNMPDLVSSVSDIQIQRGVGTSTNGAGSFGATININTNEMKPNAYAQASSSFGMFNTFKNTIEFNTGLIGDHFVFNGRLSKITSDGYIDRGWSDLKSFFISGGYYGKNSVIKFNIFSGKEVTYQSWYGVPEFLLDTMRTDNVAGTDYYQKNPAYENQTDNYQQDHYQLFYNQKIGKYINTNLALYYTRGRGFYEEFKVNDALPNYGIDSLFIGNDSITQSDLIRQLWLDNHLYGFNLSGNYQKGRINATLGGGWNNYIGDHYGKIIWMQFAGNYQPNDKYYDRTASKMDLNVFGKLDLEIIQHLNLFIDLQYRRVDYQINGFANNPDIFVHDIFHFFNPKFGLSYELKSKHQFYVYFGIANKEPNRVDYEISSTNKPTFETLRDLEIGYQFRHKIFTVSSNVFWMDYTNQLVQTGKINDVGAYTRTNTPNSFRAGLEIYGSVNILKNLKLSANFTFSQNKILDFTEYIDNYDTGIQDSVRYDITDISFSPDFIAGFTFSYSPIKNLELDITGKYVSRQYLDNTSNINRSLDPYFVNDFRIRYDIHIKKMFHIGMNVIVSNFTNRFYEPNGYSFSYTYGGDLITENWYYPQAGINVMGGITLRFEKKIN